MRTFIPKDELEEGREYPGYLATSEGLVHHSVSKTHHPVKGVPGVLDDPTPNERRTPQQRTESLAKRIQLQANGQGLPASVYQEAGNIVDKYGREGMSEDFIREIQAKAWTGGRALTFDQCKALAQAYIWQAEKEQQEADRHKVASVSPYVLDRGHQSVAPVTKEG